MGYIVGGGPIDGVAKVNCRQVVAVVCTVSVRSRSGQLRKAEGQKKTVKAHVEV